MSRSRNLIRSPGPGFRKDDYADIDRSTDTCKLVEPKGSRMRGNSVQSKHLGDAVDKERGEWLTASSKPEESPHYEQVQMFRKPKLPLSESATVHSETFFPMSGEFGRHDGQGEAGRVW